MFVLTSVIILQNNLNPQNNTLPNNWSHSIRYVNADKLNLRIAPSTESKILNTLNFGEKVVVLNDTSLLSSGGWYKIIYPYKGYVYYKYILTEKEMDELYNSFTKQNELFWDINSNWTLFEDYFVKKKPLLKNPQGKQSVSINEIKKNTKALLVLFKMEKEFPIDLKWEDDFDRNGNLYSQSATLCISPKNTDNFERKLFINLYYRKDTWDDYKLYLSVDNPGKNINPYEEPIKITIGGKERPLERGTYNFRVEIFEKDCYMMLANLDLRNPVLNSKKFEPEFEDSFIYDWVRVIYPYDSTFERNSFIDIENPWQINLLGVLCYPNLPIEKNFKSIKVNFGGMLEFTRQNWWFGFGVGYNHKLEAQIKESKEEQNIVFKTTAYYLYSKISILKIFEKIFDFSLGNKLDIYGTIGNQNFK
jgi:hypothetical protein